MTTSRMEQAPATITVVALSRAHFIRRLDELIRIHLTAMNYSSETFRQRKSLWRNNANQPAFLAFCAIKHPQAHVPDTGNPDHPIVGICYSFRGSPKTWWYQQITFGLLASGMSRQEAQLHLANYAEISEVHVAPAYQKHGIGTALVNALLSGIQEHTDSAQAMLSTPEVPNEANGAWRLYRKLGFTDLLRNFRFPADPRPFGILRKQIPELPVR